MEDVDVHVRVTRVNSRLDVDYDDDEDDDDDVEEIEEDDVVVLEMHEREGDDHSIEEEEEGTPSLSVLYPLTIYPPSYPLISLLFSRIYTSSYSSLTHLSHFSPPSRHLNFLPPH